MKVLYVTDAGDELQEVLRNRLDEGIEVVFIPWERREEARERAAEFNAVIGARISREFWERGENCEYMIIPFTGVPPQDAEVLPDFPHIKVINSHFNAGFVAEHTWALLLASAKRIFPIHEKMRCGDWTPRYEHEGSESLRDKTLLLVGYGAIGKFLAEMGRAFGMSVKAIKRTPGEAPELDFLGTRDDLPAVLPEADFIVVSLPGTENARGFLGQKEFGLMKDGVHIVNVGRGYVIDEDAFYEGLKSGKVGGAGIDTWWEYPKSAEARASTQPSKHPLSEFDNVIFSPHRASHSKGREPERMKSLAGILNSINSGAPMNLVDLKEGY
ncbi:MAG: 2-hydroxyacid dehydrogenase [Planctomycetota bacterium]|jgi:phosphoglycerate dehydrogenase-like enzyme